MGGILLLLERDYLLHFMRAMGRLGIWWRWTNTTIYCPVKVA